MLIALFLGIEWDPRFYFPLLSFLFPTCLTPLPNPLPPLDMSISILSGLLGTEVTVDLWPLPTTGPASETWEITEKIDEKICAMHEIESNNGTRPAYVRGTFQCRSTDDNLTQRLCKMG